MFGQSTNHSNRALKPIPTVIHQVVKDHLVHTLVQLPRRHTSHRVSKVETSTGHQVGNTNHLASIQVAVTLNHIPVAPSMAILVNLCRAPLHTVRAVTARKVTWANRTNPTPLYLVVNMPRPSQARPQGNRTQHFQVHQAHNPMHPSLARQAPSTTNPFLVLQVPNTVIPTLAPAVRQTHHSFPSKVVSTDHRSLAQVADNPASLYLVLLVGNTAKASQGHQVIITEVQNLLLLYIHRHQVYKTRKLTGRKLHHRMDSKIHLHMAARLPPLTDNKTPHIRLSLWVQETTSTRNMASKASILNHSRTPRSRVHRVATAPTHLRHQWALTQASKVPMQVSRTPK